MYHMKRDESGVAICNASVKTCPNGAFGHWETADEVWTAYEASNYDKTFAKTLNKNEIKKKARQNAAEEKKEALEMLRNAEDDEDRNIALSMIPANDYIWDKFSESSQKDERLWAAKKINANKTAVIDFIEYEEDPDVLYAFAENPTLEKEQAKKIYNKLKKLKNYELQDQHFVKDYTRTVRSMRDDNSETVPTKKPVPQTSQTTASRNGAEKPTVAQPVSTPSKTQPQPVPERVQKEKVVPQSHNENNKQPVNKGKKTPLQKVADSQRAAKMVVSPEFGTAFNKAKENMRDDLWKVIRDENASPERRKAAEDILRVVTQTKFSAINKKNSLLQGGTQIFSFNTTNDTDLSKIPDGLVRKHIGKLFDLNDIEYDLKKTNKSLEFHFVTQDDFDKLEFDLNVVPVS